MSIVLIEAKNPVWSNAEHTAIDIECKFEHLGDEFFPFTASPFDTMDYGRQIFENASNGLYGPVTEYEGE